ncbi:nucleotidyltransferase domain-containing protein [Bacillus hwajinpoensis]|uniref:Nucleotidyltransferase domain-containing protein n=1 Tax=Guptibacillus hwajinpoensis TaxID=208199 RepID=A0A845F5N2_9BACL|nr:nucleotidyltransferase domain-containing protein [Pseudalkalibacillus hwajinpoensis]MYL66048.1 nucleotidyltransferase domain-containing protein [Pseudalkalibacillus hwajinpoensis]
MKQEEAVRVITDHLKEEPLVKAVFLKGSMGRDEHDENSDIDLYCLVDEGDVEAFLKKRKSYLEAYSSLLFYDEIFIIAPQVIAVFDNLLHLDLFTVTAETLIEKDFCRVLYDPHRCLSHFNEQLTLSKQEFIDHVDDTAFFLFQYEKSRRRGNDIWSVHLLNQVMVHYSRVILHHYHPERAQLGLKALHKTLEEVNLEKTNEIFQHMTTHEHEKAVRLIRNWLKEEEDWIRNQLQGTTYSSAFLKRMIELN